MHTKKPTYYVNVNIDKMHSLKLITFQKCENVLKINNSKNAFENLFHTLSKFII